METNLATILGDLRAAGFKGAEMVVDLGSIKVALWGGWSPERKGRVARHSIGIEASLASGTRADSGTLRKVVRRRLLLPARQLLPRHRTRKRICRTVSIIGHHLAVILLRARRVAHLLI